VEALKPFQDQAKNNEKSTTTPATPPASTAPATTAANPPVAKPSSTPRRENNRKKENSVASAAKELEVLEAILNQDSESAQKLLTEDKEIPKQRLVRYELKLANLDKAADAARTLPKDAPGTALRLDALVLAGKADEARKFFDKARTTDALLDADLQVSHRMDEIAAQLGFNKNWRSPQAPRPDSGARPALDTLGPVHWHPWAAGDFSLPNKDGQRVTLSQFHGKPVVVLFYLGHVCGHCMEQLKAFEAATKDFDAAGIQVVAVGAEPVAELAQTQTNAGEDGSHGFTFLSDASYDTFKKWRCYDDFEGMGLHGAFLVDAAGLVRWADVGYEPFKDASFLLKESQRLLKFSAPEITQR
jgi:peroxiredoxin